jgi:hypothetical protein
MGNMTKEEFYERQGKGILTTSAGTVGGTLGAATAQGTALALGFSSAPALVPILGGLSGGLIAGMAMTLAIENGVEKPYLDLVKNTSALREAAQVLEETSQTVLKGQILFTKFLESDAELEERLNMQFNRIDAAGNNALNAINKI